MKKGILYILATLLISSLTYAQDTYYVNSSSGSDDNDGTIGSPWATISNAVSDATEGSTIMISGTFTESNIKVQKNLTIIGESALTTIIQGQEGNPHDESPRAYRINGHIMSMKKAEGTLVLKNITFRHGNSSSNGGAVSSAVDSDLTIISCNFVDNFAYAQGGALYTKGSVTVESCSFVNNYGRTNGGGIAQSNNGVGDVTVSNTLLYNNTVETTHGGGIKSQSATLTLKNNTIVQNISLTTGRIEGVFYSSSDGGVLTMTNNIFYHNTKADDNKDSGLDIGNNVTGTCISKNNIFSYVLKAVYYDDSEAVTTASGNFVNAAQVNAELLKFGTLTQNENGIWTLPLLEGSMAIDAGDPSTATSEDINGVTRTNPDIGAYEYVAPNNDNEWDGTWSKGTPTQNDDIVIKADYKGAGFTGKSLIVENGQTLEVGNGTLDIKGDFTNNGTVIIKSGASLFTYEGTTFSGNNISIERNTRYSNGQYSFVGSVVKRNTTIKGNSLGKSIYKYDETVAYGDDEGLERWVKASRDILEPGIGYTQAFKQLLTFKGEPNNGTVTVTGTFTDRGETNTDGWNLLANPYPTAIDAIKFLENNTTIQGAIYLWDDNGSHEKRGTNDDYIVINKLGVVTDHKGLHGHRFNSHLGAGQGFFVQLNNTGNNISFTESMRVAGKNSDDNFFRQATNSKELLSLALESTDGEIYTSTLLGFLEEATDGIDRLYDAPQLSTKALQLYSLIDGRNYAIQGLPQHTGEKMIALGIDIADAGTYKIEVAKLENFDENKVIELIDTKLNIIHNLSENKVYTFESDNITNDKRFYLNVKNTAPIISSLENRLANNIRIKADIKGIKLFGANNYNVTIMDITGKMLLNQTLKNRANINFSFTKNKMYIIKVNGKVEKIIFN